MYIPLFGEQEIGLLDGLFYIPFWIILGIVIYVVSKIIDWRKKRKERSLSGDGELP